MTHNMKSFLGGKEEERRNYNNLQEIICCRKRAELTFLLDIHSFNPCSAKLMDFVTVPTCKNNPRLLDFQITNFYYFLFLLNQKHLLLQEIFPLVCIWGQLFLRKWFHVSNNKWSTVMQEDFAPWFVHL